MLTSLAHFVHETKPYKIKYSSLRYTNFVITVQLVPEGYSLALESILAHNYGGFITSQSKRQISKLVIRIKHSVGKTTHMLFRSGIMNTVGAKSVEHARFGAQYIRQYISKIPGVYYNENQLPLES